MPICAIFTATLITLRVAQKMTRTRISRAPAEAAPPKVVDLMEALRKSLEQVSGGKKKAAKVAAEGRSAPKKRKAS